MASDLTPEERQTIAEQTVCNDARAEAFEAQEGLSIGEVLSRLDQDPEMSPEVYEACKRLTELPGASLIFGSPPLIADYVSACDRQFAGVALDDVVFRRIDAS